uniref:Uncharacterized protein n=1 Tax=Acrobeloides nanus TaxID=290746 RepID=A0A914DZM9_9BILA
MSLAVTKTFNPLHVGINVDGKFDQEHVDFEVCFGFAHTKKAAKFICFLPILSLVFQFIIATAMLTFLYYFSILIQLPFCLALIYGIFKEKDGWCCFQQDEAPGHKAIKTQQFLSENCPDFIKVNTHWRCADGEWPTSSPDLKNC